MSNGDPAWWSDRHSYTKEMEEEKIESVSMYGGVPVFKSNDPDNFTMDKAAAVMVDHDLQRKDARVINDIRQVAQQQVNQELVDCLAGTSAIADNAITNQGIAGTLDDLKHFQQKVIKALSINPLLDHAEEKKADEYINYDNSGAGVALGSGGLASHSHDLTVGGYGGYSSYGMASGYKDLAIDASNVETAVDLSGTPEGDFVIAANTLIVRDGTGEINILQELDDLKLEVAKLRGDDIPEKKPVDNNEDPFELAMKGV